ncbi:hypothetical protein N7470_002598 [Penicillium chermesinum]|nr:hypothetical protein N7470_002598 [Penicillium chermesinum]
MEAIIQLMRVVERALRLIEVLVNLAQRARGPIAATGGDAREVPPAQDCRKNDYRLFFVDVNGVSSNTADPDSFLPLFGGTWFMENLPTTMLWHLWCC